jgi:hypothetical protein
MDIAPLWLQHLTLLIALPLAVEGGYQTFVLITARRPGAPATSEWDDWQVIVTASISILGLLAAFTVSMAVGHYEERRQLVVREANAISTSYLRAQLFAEPARGRLSSQLVTYARDRKLIFDAGDDRVRIARAQATTDDNQRRLWSVTAEAVRQPGDAVLTIPFLNAMNEMFDLAAAREASLEERVPSRVVRIVVIYAFVTAGLVGYGLAGIGRRRRIGSTLVFLMIAMTISLILDLDHPRSGAITVPEAPLIRVTAALIQDEAAKAQAVGAPPQHVAPDR